MILSKTVVELNVESNETTDSMLNDIESSLAVVEALDDFRYEIEDFARALLASGKFDSLQQIKAKITIQEF